MGAFSEYMAGHGTLPPQEELNAVLQKYPWFMTARILLAETATEHDPLLALHRLTHPQKRSAHAIYPNAENAMISDTEASENEQPTNEERIADTELIDTFLSKGEYRIVPDNTIPEYDAAETSSVLDITDDMISEELADIYLAQGLKAQAREIYARLSLLNPEKSVYFAEIIGKIDSEHDQ